MLYFIVTTSIFNDCPIRKNQYITGIQQLKKIVNNLEIMCKIIIVENNGKPTFLDSLDCEVFYTENNHLKTTNKGYKELQDILDCIDKYNIQDTDFIVKMTGRYVLNDDSEFMYTIKQLNHTHYNCVIQYGSYMNPVNYKMNDCITGLIGMSCGYVKQIEKPNENECVEWKWGKVTHRIDDTRICKVNQLGIHICPSSNYYFLV
jgi:hypothetical protein